MAKYSELTQGQIEAFMNKVGGMIGLKYFLSDNTWTANHREEVAFSRAYETTKSLRDLLRGWGKYETKDNSGGDTFSVLLSYITDISINLSKSALQGGGSSFEGKDKIQEAVLDKIERVKEWLIEFRIRENSPFGLEGWLNDLRDGLRQNDHMKVLEVASKLRGYVAGIEWHNDFIRPK